MAINRIKTGGITDGTIQSGDLAPGNIANDRLANNTITINGTSIALGASGDIVAGTDWQAVTVADGSTTVNTVAGGGYLLDTNAGVIEAFLPTSPSRGDTVVIADYSGTFATNRVIVNTGGANIDSTATGDVQLTTNNTIAEFIYIDSSKGWLVKLNQAAGTTPSSANNITGTYDGVPPQFTEATGGTITTSGDYKIHAFTGDGCFSVTQAGNEPVFPGNSCAGPNTVSYLVVAGGGGGSTYAVGAGGGGGFRLGSDVAPQSTPLSAGGLTISATTYPITVGSGGVGGSPGSPGNGTQGSPSVFSTITSAGGGAGGNFPTPGPTDGSLGGSGGGIGRDAYLSGRTSSSNGNSPPVSPPQGNDGGVHVYPADSNGSAGGGGAGSAVAPAGPETNGGNPAPVTAIFGAAPQPFYTGSPANGQYSGGGGAGTFQGNGGGGGGNIAGASGSVGPGIGTDGQVNSGGGGGSAGPGSVPGGAGGKGVVLIRYKFQ